MICIQLLSNRLFYGTLRQRLVAPLSEGSRALSTHESENVFSILPVSVSDEGYDLYDGLSSYFHSTAQLYSNTVSMEITLVDLPPVLQIQLQVCGPRYDYYSSSRHVSVYVEGAMGSRDGPIVEITGIRKIWRNDLHGSFP